MFIELLGLSGVKIQSGDLVVLLSPPDSKGELKASRTKADIVVYSNPKDDVNVEARAEKLFAIKSPGEYEASGVFVYCLSNPEKGEPKSLLSSVSLEGITVAHLGGLGHELTSSQLELFEGTDVLIVPIGGNDVLNAKAAKQLVDKVEPRVVIPMHFSQKGLKTNYDDVEKFFKEIGTTPQAHDRIKLTKKELPQETMDILHLKP